MFYTAVSPSSGCYSETVNTLRYAQRAKRIVNQPVVNSGMPEETAARTIRELQAEVSRLRTVLAALQGVSEIIKYDKGVRFLERVTSRLDVCVSTHSSK
jgi:hypothetical protein